jgi:hypothetical protein
MNQFTEYRNHVGILRLPLIDTLLVLEFWEAIRAIDDLYFGNLWLSLAEESDGSTTFPDYYMPSDDEALWISRLEIGTPNFLELVGQVAPLVPVFGTINALLGFPSALASLIKYLDERKARKTPDSAEPKLPQIHYDVERGIAREERIEIATRDIDTNMAERARRLRAQGKISQEALVHKEEIEITVKSRVQGHTTICIKGRPTLHVVVT